MHAHSANPSPEVFPLFIAGNHMPSPKRLSSEPKCLNALDEAKFKNSPLSVRRDAKAASLCPWENEEALCYDGQVQE
jgi:hypothetical protein